MSVSDEFNNGQKIFKVTNHELTPTPVSELLCSNFLEVGFGYQVEAMWSEMLHNRSFEKAIPYVPNNYNWFGIDFMAGDLWQDQEWYHTAYELNRWYACPAQDAPLAIRPDSSFIVEKAPFYSLTVSQEKGGIHGNHCLHIHNFEQDRWCGVAQNGIYLRPGTYLFHGYFKQLSSHSAAEVRFYPGHEEISWDAPALTFPIKNIHEEGCIIEFSFTWTESPGWFAFSVFVSPNTKLELDAFSLMPTDTRSGWRPEVVAALQKVNPHLIRFPGGCFASYHDWTDAIGPMDNRRPEPSYSWGDINYNDVGTDEFLQLCEMVNCEPMLVVNLFHPNKRLYRKSALHGSEIEPHGFILDNITNPDMGLERAVQWVEYCNGSVDTKYGMLRAKNGHPAPYNVTYWEMDNEAFRWFTWEEYAQTVRRYAKAMKAIDFLADRMCEPDNIAKKIAIVEQYNATHNNHIFYADTEALQNRDMTPAPFVGAYFKEHNIKFHSARRTWLYALNLVSNLMMYHRYGDIAKFLCFNNLCNTTGQSCIEVAKDKVILSFCGYIFEHMSRTEARWPLEISDYIPSARKDIQIQAAWDAQREKLICYFLNRTDRFSTITLDLGILGQGSFSAVSHTMSAENGLIQETMKHQGNLKECYHYLSVNPTVPQTFSVPPFSFIEFIISKI